MRKNNKLFLIFTILYIIGSSYQPIYAADGDSISIATPYNDFIKYTTVSLTKVDGKANCTASITAYSSVSNVSIYIYLQKYEDGTWNTVESFYDSSVSYSLTINKKFTVTTGRYRLKASYYANGENIVKYSSEKQF